MQHYYDYSKSYKTSSEGRHDFGELEKTEVPVKLAILAWM